MDNKLKNKNYKMAYTPEKDYLYAKINAGQSTDFTTADHVKFDTIIKQRGTGITLDTTTAYTNTANVDSVGRFTLTNGKTYKISITLRVTTSSSAITSAFIIRNSDTSTDIGDYFVIYPFTFSSNHGSNEKCTHIFTATNNRYEIRFYNGNTTVITPNTSAILIEEI